MVLESLSVGSLFSNLAGLLFGNYGLLALFVLIFALVVCVINGLDTLSTILLILPVLIGLISGSFLPSLAWSFIILFISFLWVFAGLKLIGEA